MKKFLTYLGIGIGALAALFVLIIIVVIFISDDKAEQDRLGYQAGFAYGILLVVLFVGLILYGMYRLVVALFMGGSRNEEQQSLPGVGEKILGKDDPIDRYMK